MAGFLFHDIIFGPVRSRRLGISLGINTLPADVKLCTFNCIYCECGWTDSTSTYGVKIPERRTIKDFLERKLIELKESEIVPDSLTFAGNGEPTVHPEFAAIIDDTIELRDKYFPGAKVTVLTNGSTLHKSGVFESLQCADQNIIKLDTGEENTFIDINQPGVKTSLPALVEYLQKFNGNLIIQTLFLRGEVNGKQVDNTTDGELRLWLQCIGKIRPRYVMIYSIDRDTPAEGLEKVTLEELERIAEMVNMLGVHTRVYE